MKRAILVILTILAVATIALSVGGVFDIAGVARILVVAGAVLLGVASVDGLRSLTLASQKPPLPESVETAAAETVPVETAPIVPATENIIDLRDSLRLVDELIATGELTASGGPILDCEVAPLVMLAMVDQSVKGTAAA